MINFGECYPSEPTKLFDSIPAMLPSPLAWYRADEGASAFGGALFTAASSQWLSAGGQIWSDGLKRFSFSLSLMLTSLGSQSGLCGKWQYQSQGQFALQVDSDNRLKMWVAASLTEDGSNFAKGSTALQTNTLYNLVVVYDGTLAAANRLQFYVNGASETMTTGGTLPTSMTTSTADFTIGRAFTGSLSRFFSGPIWRFAAWPGAALSQADAVALHNHRAGCSYRDLPPSLSAAASQGWDLNEGGTGSRNSAASGANLSSNGSVPATTIGQWTDLFGRGNTAVGFGSATVDLTGLNGRPAFNLPAATFSFFDCGFPAGANQPPSWSVYSVAQVSSALANTFSWIHTSYPPAIHDKDSWGVLLAGDVYGTTGSFAVAYGDGTNHSLGESNGGLIAPNVPFKLSTRYNSGDSLMTARVNGAQAVLSSTAGPGPNHPSASSSGPAYNSTIGNPRATGYPATATRLIGELILYAAPHSLAHQQAIEAYQLKFWGV